MQNEVINKFLTMQKNHWLSKEIKPKTSDKKKESLKQQANELFSNKNLKETILKVVNNKNIDRLNFSSHIPKFSNPSIRIDGFVFNTKKGDDNFVRSGNIKNKLDIYSNSGAGDHTKELIYVYEFLTFDIDNENNILEHLKNNTTQINEIFTELNIKGEEFSEIRLQLLSMVNKNEPTKTSEAIKQVYFPVDDNYHLLSILYPSPVMSELRTRIGEMKFADNIKQAKEDKKKNIFNEQEISDIYNLTKIGFGGANKQNVSILNNKNGGDFYLLPSIPPMLNYRKIQPPKSNFFTNCLYVKNFDDDFKKLRQLFSDKDTMYIKSERNYRIKHIVYQILETVWQVKNIDANWSNSDTYKELTYQKIWLDKAYKYRRAEVDFDLIKKDLLNWIVESYNKNIDNNLTKLNDNHRTYIEEIIDDLQEALV
jgi:CRISPR-associated protein Csy1